MYTGYSSGLRPYQMLTPSSVALTQSLVNDAISQITVQDNGDTLFRVVDNVIEPLQDLPIQTSTFKVAAYDDEIDADETNAVNKRYASSKFLAIDGKAANADKIEWTYNSSVHAPEHSDSIL